MIKIKISTR